VVHSRTGNDEEENRSREPCRPETGI
jgi:hypothetical protein